MERVGSFESASKDAGLPLQDGQELEEVAHKGEGTPRGAQKPIDVRSRGVLSNNKVRAGLVLMALAAVAAGVISAVVLTRDSGDDTDDYVIIDGLIDDIVITPSAALQQNESVLFVSVDADCQQVLAMNSTQQREFGQAAVNDVKAAALASNSIQDTDTVELSWPPLCGSVMLEFMVRSEVFKANRQQARLAVTDKLRRLGLQSLRAVARRLQLSGTYQMHNDFFLRPPPIDLVPTPAPTGTSGGVLIDTGVIVDPTALAARIPLTVTTILPISGTKLDGRDAVTVVFGRSVIALGSAWKEAAGSTDSREGVAVNGVAPAKLTCTSDEPVPGYWRWVTTAILRFDPAVDWPSDIECTVAVNPALRSYDGALLVGDRSQAQFGSNQLQIRGIEVQSAVAEEITGGVWKSSLSSGQGEAHEVPSDGVVTIYFSHAIDVGRIDSILSVADRGGSAVSVKATQSQPSSCRSCNYYSPWQEPGRAYNDYAKGLRTCASFTLESAVKSGLDCALTLKKGVRPHLWAGPTTATSSDLSLVRLAPFAFPFFDSGVTTVTNSRLAFWLRHGLQQPPQSTLNAMANTFSITNASGAVHVANVRLRNTYGFDKKAELMIDADLQPGSTYALSVNPSPSSTCSDATAVCDGFGLPLQRSELQFRTARLESFIEPVVGSSVFDNSAGVPSSFTVLKRNSIDTSTTHGRVECQGVDWRMANVQDTDDDIAAVISEFTNSNGGAYFSRKAGTKTITSSAGPPDTVVEHTVPTDDLFGSSGVFLAGRRNRLAGTPAGCDTRYGQYNQPYLVHSADFGVILTALGHNADVLVTVLDMRELKPVSGATVRLFQQRRNERARRVGQAAATDASGSVRISIEECSSSRISAAVSYQGKLVLERNVHHPGMNCASPSGVAGLLITDRQVYSPGDEIAVKGYLRQYNVESGALETVQSAVTLQTSSCYNRRHDEKDGDGSSGIYADLRASDAYGSIGATVRVPLDAQPSSRLQLFLCKDGKHASAATVTVADPRIPTAVLKVEHASPIYRTSDGANKGLLLDISTTTYTGSPVGAAEVELTWEVNGEKGTVTVTSDSAGKVSHRLDIGEAAVAGAWLSVQAKWVAPSREILTESFGVNVAASEWALVDAKYELFADVPGSAPFTARLVTQPGAADPAGQEVAVKAYRLPDVDVSITTGGCNYNSVQKPEPLPAQHATQCTATVGPAPAGGDSRQVGCDIALPGMGRYMLVAEVVDPAGVKVAAKLQAGRQESSWREQPLATLPGIRATTDRTEFTVGDTVKLDLETPFAASTVVLVWGSSSMQTQLSSLSSPSGSVSFVIGKECAVFCHVQVAIVGRGAAQQLHGVPTSPLLDTSLARFRSTSVQLTMVSGAQPLGVAVQHPEKVLPGASVDIEVKTAPSAEVTVMVVDKAVYDLQPSPLPSEAADVVTREAANRVGLSRWMHTNQHSTFQRTVGVTQSAEAVKVEKRRAAADRLYTPSLSVAGERWSTHLDVSDEDMRENRYDRVTEFPYTGGYYFRGGGGVYGDDMLESAAVAAGAEADGAVQKSAPSMAPPPNMEDNSAGSAPPSSTKVFIRSDFNPRAAFVTNLVAGADGAVRTTVTLPDNVGTWLVRVISAAANAPDRFGFKETELIAKRPLTIQPSLPRIVRFGDTFTGGCIVTDTDVNGDVQVSLGAVGGLTTSPSQKTAAIQTGRVSEVLFSFSADRLSPDTNVTVAASMAGVAQDGFKVRLPVLAPQLPVDVATSFTIAATETGAAWSEGVDLPEAVPGSGVASLVAGVGHASAVESLLVGMRTALREAEEPTGALLVSQLVAVTAGERYHNKRWHEEASNEYRARGASLLRTYTHPDLGLVWMNTRYWPAWRPDVRLNAFAVYVASGSPDTTLLLAPLIPVWKKAVRRGLYESVEDSRRGGWKWEDWDTLCIARLAMGTDDSLVEASDRAAKETLSFASLFANRDKLSQAGKARLALLILEHRSPTQEWLDAAGAIATELHSTLRTQGRTAYVSYGSQGHASDLLTQSVAASALDKARRRPSLRCGGELCTQMLSQQLVAKLLAHVAAGGSSNRPSYLWGFSAEECVGRVRSLSAYDVASASADPDVALTVSAHPGAPRAILMHKRWKGQQDASVLESKSYVFSDITHPSAKVPSVGFLAQGKGEVSVAFGLHFIPAAMPSQGVYFGLWVEKQLRVRGKQTQAADQGPYTFAPGDVVEITIQVTTPDDIYGGVEIVDLPAGGLEPNDPQIGTPARRTHNNHRSYPSPRAAWWYMMMDVGSFPHARVLPHRVTWFAQYLPAGTHTCTYTANAVTSGTFSLPPARATAARQPELMGLSTAGTVVVTPRS
eukprot:TRINITY_DN1485_c0_g1_i1.p1 TRINITY_DN1485_c0_g1~~TRINITY_DN1485_c0_g1_i1.p1  ORF type:complete len:2335 (+),score=541.26 TRINITY_DN1485_c0_g1_i1:189-7193(+)